MRKDRSTKSRGKKIGKNIGAGEAMKKVRETMYKNRKNVDQKIGGGGNQSK